MSRQADAASLGRVAVLMGGWSAEREISLRSGRAVYEALRRWRVDAVAIDADRQVLDTIRRARCDRAFIALHGRGGEDGVIQAGLELMGLPYTGTGVLGSALAMDKLRSKQVWLGAGLPTPPFRQPRTRADTDPVPEELGLPLIVKPSREGSSIGMTKVETPQALGEAWEAAVRFDDEVIVERWVEGEEYTVSILDGQVLPAIRLETPRTFYDYKAKYHAGDTRYLCPCGLSDDALRELEQLSLRAFRALDGSGWGRVDLMRDRQGGFWLLEVNTVPGLTDHSLVPMAAAAAGLDFAELVWRILQTTLARGEG